MTSHHRRGELGWNLETIGKLIIGVATLILIVYLSIKLVGVFIGNSADSAAYRNLHLLGERIEATKQQELQGPAASVIFDYPSSGYLVSFTATMQNLGQCEGTEVAGFQIARPKSCGKNSCICLALEGEILACHELSMEMVTFASYDAPQRQRCVLTSSSGDAKILTQSLEIERTATGVIVHFDEGGQPGQGSGQALADQYGRGP